MWWVITNYTSFHSSFAIRKQRREKKVITGNNSPFIARYTVRANAKSDKSITNLFSTHSAPRTLGSAMFALALDFGKGISKNNAPHLRAAKCDYCQIRPIFINWSVIALRLNFMPCRRTRVALIYCYTNYSKNFTLSQLMKNAIALTESTVHFANKISGMYFDFGLFNTQ